MSGRDLYERLRPRGTHGVQWEELAPRLQRYYESLARRLENASPVRLIERARPN